MRTAIVSASLSETAVLDGLLRTVPSEIAWVESDTKAAAERCRVDPPDVLLVSLGVAIDGVTLVEDVMAARPCAILVLTEDMSRDVHRVYAALAAGALDAQAMPRLSSGIDHTADERRLIAKLRRLGGRDRSRRDRARRPCPEPVLAIGASTGGPHALARVLSHLPPGLTAPVLLAQHIDDEFLPGLAEFLTARAGRKVDVAAEGVTLEAGRILLVRTDVQASIDAAGRVKYHLAAPGNPLLPCIDTLFQSLAGATSVRGVAALLTGMGADGASGLLSLRRAGWVTLAQDAESSVVFGMPKAAADLGAATEVVPLDEIAKTAVRALARLRRELTP